MLRSRRTVLLVILFAAVTAFAIPAWSQNTPVPRPSDQQIYETFRFWITKQPPGDTTNEMDRYRKVLASEGVAPAEIERRLRVIETEGRRLEIEMWNRILTAEKPIFTTEPNAFLVRMTQGRKPGRALDVGMATA